MPDAVSILDHNGHPLERASVSTLTQSKLERIIRNEVSGAWGGGRLMQSAWAYSCVMQTAAQFAGIDIGLWTKNARYEQIENDDVLELLEKPNPYQSGYQFKEEWCARLLEGGNVWVYKRGKRRNGLPKELYVLGRHQVSPVRPYGRGPAEYWQVTKPDGSIGDFPLSEMIHSKFPNPYDDCLGLAPMDALALSLSADHARQVYDEAFFKRNADPTAVLRNKSVPYLDDKQREQILSALKSRGPQNAGGWIALGGDWDITPLSFPHSQLQFLDVRKLTRSEIAAGFNGFPVVLLNSEETGGLSRAEHEAARLILIENCVLPQTARFSADFNRFLVSDYRQGVVLEFNTDMNPLLITTQLAAKVKILAEGVRSGLAPNQMIQMLDLPTGFVKGGDSGFLTSNFVPLEMLGEVDIAPAVDGGEDDDEDVDEDVGTTDMALRSPPQGEASPIQLRAEQKFKAALWQIRKAAIQRKSVDDVARGWARSFLALSAATYQLGLEQVCRDHVDGQPTWIEDVRDVDAAIKELQSNAKSIRFSSQRMARECEAHSSHVISKLRSIAAWARGIAEKDQDDLPRAMSQLDQAARRLSEGFVWGVLSAGRYEGIANAGLRVGIRQRNDCQLDHNSGKYPGRVSETNEMVFCGCTVGVASDGGGVRRMTDVRATAQCL